MAPAGYCLETVVDGRIALVLLVFHGPVEPLIAAAAAALLALVLELVAVD